LAAILYRIYKGNSRRFARPILSVNPLLLPAEPLYRRAMRRRRAANLRLRERALAPCPIVSVGNLTTGGTGKTPTTQWLARALQNRGLRVGVALRGYGGNLSDGGALVSDGQQTFLGPQVVGDEAALHARNLPGVVVAVAKDRQRATQLALQYGAQIVILDDGFQFWSLPRAFDLVLLDAKRPWGNGHLLPVGRLREEKTELGRADAVLLTRVERPTLEELARTHAEIRELTDAPVFESWHKPLDLRVEKTGEILPLGVLKGELIKAFAGLADNGQFYRMLRSLGVPFINTPIRERGDHHAWKRRDFNWTVPDMTVMGALNERSFKATITTEKDAVKVDADWFSNPLWSLRIALQLRDDEAALEELIWKSLEL